jgi:fluoroacetyl-CoA thioesterase
MEVKDYIEAGTVAEEEYQVSKKYTAPLVGSGSLQVLATPSMIAFVERVAHKMLEQRLPAGFSSVGVEVNMRHMAPSPVGARVRVHCQVVVVDGKRVNFTSQVWEGNELVGEGTHQRVVIDVAWFKQRMQANRG